MTEPERLAVGVWCIDIPAETLPPWTHSRAFLLGRGGVAWLVDPGGAGAAASELIAALLEAAGVHTLKGILLTHSHRDHVAGVAGVLERHGPLPLLAHPASSQRLAPLLPTGTAITPLLGGRRLMAGDEVIESIETPGHASDHLAFWLSSTRSLIAGDLVSGRGSTWVGTPDGDVATYLDSLARAASLDPLLVAPAHGPLRRDGAAVFASARAHRLEREAAVLRALASEARDLGALRVALYPDLPEVARDFADRSILAHLQKLMREGRVMHAGVDEQGPYLRTPGGE